MRDYTQPPTEEFAMVAEHGTRYRGQWLTLMKSVMNDYWFDISMMEQLRSWGPEKIDMVMHKIYFCWQQHIIEEDEGNL